MKKKSTSKSAFFNLRVLIGLCIALAGIGLALLGLDAFAANSAPVKVKNHIITASNDPLVPVGFDCSKIQVLGIDKQENMRAGAIMIACGEADVSGSSVGGVFQRIGQAVTKLLAPLSGAGDVNLITGTETPPNITQSETFTWANPDNPHAGCCRLQRLTGPQRQSHQHIRCIGLHRRRRYLHPRHQRQRSKPLLQYYGRPCCLSIAPRPPGSPSGLMRVAAVRASVDTSPPIPRTRIAGPISVFTTAAVTIESLVGRITTPPLRSANRMYVSWNDFNVGGGALFVTYSSDNGTTWHSPISVTPTFIRDVQITGDKVTGDVYIAGMDENSGNGCSSGCGTPRNNKIYRSTDGGNTWTNTYTGPTFIGPCRSNSGYFCTMYSQSRLLAAHGLG